MCKVVNPKYIITFFRSRHKDKDKEEDQREKERNMVYEHMGINPKYIDVEIRWDHVNKTNKALEISEIN